MFRLTSTKRIQHKSLAKQVGMTFIEVLIALVIMVTGILGAVAMQATAKKGSFDAMQRSLASSLAQDIIEKMRGNSSNNLNNYAGTGYGTGVVLNSPTCNAIGALCTPAQMITHDLFAWEQALMGANSINGVANIGGLTGGVGCIIVNGNSITVAVSWEGKAETVDANEIANCGTASKTRRQVVIDSFII